MTRQFYGVSVNGCLSVNKTDSIKSFTISFKSVFFIIIIIITTLLQIAHPIFG